MKKSFSDELLYLTQDGPWKPDEFQNEMSNMKYNLNINFYYITTRNVMLAYLSLIE